MHDSIDPMDPPGCLVFSRRSFLTWLWHEVVMIAARDPLGFFYMTPGTVSKIISPQGI